MGFIRLRTFVVLWMSGCALSVYPKGPGGLFCDARGQVLSGTKVDASSVDKTELQAICDSIVKYTSGDGKKYQNYFKAVTSTQDYSNAQTYLEPEWPASEDGPLSEEECQEMLDNTTLALNKAFRKAPFEYVKSNCMNWYESFFGKADAGNGEYSSEEWQQVFDNSDYASILSRATSILTTYSGREQEITYDQIWKVGGSASDESQENVDGIIPMTEELIPDQKRSYKNSVMALRDILKSIKEDDSGAYDALKEKSLYQIPLGWFQPSDWEVKDSEDFSFDEKTHNQTFVNIYLDRLNTEISFINVVFTYRTTVTFVNGEIIRYFDEDERTPENEDWKLVNDTISEFVTLLDGLTYNTETGEYTCGGSVYSSLEDLQAFLNDHQAKMQNIPQNLENKRATYEQNLRDFIAVAQKLYAHLGGDGNGKGETVSKSDLLEAINEATTAVNNGSSFLSNYTEGYTALKSVYDVVYEAYQGLVTALQDVLANAKEENQKWNDDELADAILSAEALIKKAEQVEAMDSEISSATENLQTSVKIATVRFTLNENLEQVKEYQKIYGDEDQSLQALLEESASVSGLDALVAQNKKVQEKLKAVEEAYQSACEQLLDRIEDSKRYYEAWKDARDMEALKEAYEKAEGIYSANSTEESKNILALQNAYKELDDIYAELGGYSDPFEARQELIALIAEAEVYWKKYRYDDLRNAINEANRNVNSETRYILNQQIANLKTEIENAKLQYANIVERVTTQYTQTEQKMSMRYGEDLQEEDRNFLKMVNDSIQQSPTVEGELVCTNVPLLQEYYRDLQTLAENADKLWEEAVKNFYTAIQEADLLYNSTYPDDENLRDAIAHAQSEYTKIAENYLTIASVEGLQEALEQEVARVETNDRRGVANQFIRLYAEISKKFETYGSDEKSPHTSAAKTYLETNKEMYDELANLSGDDIIIYTLPELMAFVNEATAVRDAYYLFCGAADMLDATIKNAEDYNGKYYEDRLEDNNLYRTIEKAKWARFESLNMDSLECYNYALQDTLAQTAVAYRKTLQTMNASRSLARSKHIIYYGSASEESEIMDAYNKAEAYVNDLCFTHLEKMTVELDTCYRYAEDSCAVLETEIQQVIDDAESLNKLMNDTDFDRIIAAAINARYSNDGRIAAIRENIVVLQKECDDQKAKYEEATATLKTHISDARKLLNKLYDKTLESSIVSAEKVASKADWELSDAVSYTVVMETGNMLLAEQDRVNQVLAEKLAEIWQTLKVARDEAFARNTLYYGSDNTDNEIMKVYNESTPYLESDDLNAIALMIDSVNNSYVTAAVRCLNLEAEIDNLVRKASPLATLMEDESLSTLIKEATDSRNVAEARILAIDAVLQRLREAYESNAALYDQSMYDLNDSIQIANELILKHYDVALEKAIAQAEDALENAGKTSSSCTKYAVLQEQIKSLAIEMERVRQEMITTSVDAVHHGNREVNIYTLEGYFVKRVRLSDPNAFRNIPKGVYIVDGKKMVLPQK